MKIQPKWKRPQIKEITIEQYKKLLTSQGIKWNWVEIRRVKAGDRLGNLENTTYYLKDEINS